ncbi:MAG: hypothetical protein SXU28_03690 [Pseudomonadota bacterium]|nr:hypothetical protein [Pseudomonadota bacterium]
MIGRIVFYAALLAIAIVTAGLQMDRQTAASPQLAPAVPDVFRSIAQARIAANAVGSGNSQAALEEAEKLVMRRPVPSQSLRLLALAQYGAGDIQAGSYSIQIAAQRGWRDIAAQEAMLSLALAAGDKPEAVLRYVALLANDRASEEFMTQSGQSLFGSGDEVAIETLTEIAMDTERWRGGLVRKAGQFMPPPAFAEFVEQVAGRLDGSECEIFKRSAKRVGRSDKAASERIEAVIQKSC